MEKILRVIISKLNRAERERAYHRELLLCTNIPDFEHDYHERQAFVSLVKKAELLGILRECGVKCKETMRYNVEISDDKLEALTVEYLTDYEIIDSESV